MKRARFSEEQIIRAQLRSSTARRQRHEQSGGDLAIPAAATGPAPTPRVD
jgi:hypothetical protein